MQHWPFFAILIAGIVLSLLAVGLTYWRQGRDTPKPYRRGVRVRWLPGTVQPWPGLEEAIDAMTDVVEAQAGSGWRRLLDRLWIEVVPYDGLVRSDRLPTGYVGWGTTDVRRATGTVRVERLLFRASRYVLVVRQLRQGDTSEMNRDASGTGTLRPAGTSALFHELAQHLIPWASRGQWNEDHLDIGAREMEQQMRARYSDPEIKSGLV